MARKASNDEELDEELEETDDEDLEDVEDDEEDVAAGLALASDDEEEEEASLEDLLAQRASGRRAAGESDEDEDEDSILALSSQPELNPNEEIKTKVIPIKDRQEFVCNRCHLVKARSQLADEDRGLCRDCV